MRSNPGNIKIMPNSSCKLCKLAILERPKRPYEEACDPCLNDCEVSWKD